MNAGFFLLILAIFLFYVLLRILWRSYIRAKIKMRVEDLLLLETEHRVELGEFSLEVGDRYKSILFRESLSIAYYINNCLDLVAKNSGVIKKNDVDNIADVIFQQVWLILSLVVTYGGNFKEHSEQVVADYLDSIRNLPEVEQQDKDVLLLKNTLEFRKKK